MVATAWGATTLLCSACQNYTTLLAPLWEVVDMDMSTTSSRTTCNCYPISGSVVESSIGMCTLILLKVAVFLGEVESFPNEILSAEKVGATSIYRCMPLESTVRTYKKIGTLFINRTTKCPRETRTE